MQELRIPSVTEDVIAIAFSPDANVIAAGTDRSNIHLWDASNWTLVSTLRNHSSDVNSISFSSDGTLLSSASDDNSA